MKHPIELTPGELAKKLLEVLGDPELHDQGHWCGTRQCMAGWGATFLGYEMGKDGYILNDKELPIDERHCITVTGRALGLPLGLYNEDEDETEWRLFYGVDYDLIEEILSEVVNREHGERGDI